MRIALISDTHSHIDERILEHCLWADEIWHAGDIGSHEVIDQLEATGKTCRIVYGNIDNHSIRQRVPADQHFMAGPLRVWITHIGGYPPKYNSKTRAKLALGTTDLFVCGHSHILKVIHDPKINCLHMNPGSCGTHGFHAVKTLLRFEITAKGVENLEVVELGKRGGLR